ncbi:MAG: terminase small subunit [Desulfovibrio sp.]
MAGIKPKNNKKVKQTGKLAPRMTLFVDHYLITLNSHEAALKAGYSAKTAAVMGRRLLCDPRIHEAIDRAMAERTKRLHINQDMILQELMGILRANISDFLVFGPDGVVLKDIKDIPPEKLAALKEVSEGKAGVRVSMIDKMEAIEKIARHLGMYDKTGQAKKRQHEFTKEILTKFRNKEISALEAAVDLDIEGYPLPDSIRAALSRMEPEQQVDDGEYAVITPEEMAAKAANRRMEIENQKTFVEDRKTEVADLKEVMGGGSYDMEKLSEEDGGKEIPDA